MHVAKRSAQGGIVLFAGNLLATVGQTIASILIARLLGPNQYGTYSLALVIPSLLQLFVGFGVNTSVTRYVAHHMTLNQPEAAKRFAQSALVVSLLFGIVLSGVCYLSATAFSQALFQRAYLAQYVRLASAVVLGQAILNAAIAAAIGWNAMGQASLASIMVALTKLLLSPLLIVAGFGLAGAVAGQTLAAVIGAGLAAGILYWTKVRPLRFGWRNLISDTKEMLSYGYPAFTANILIGVGPYYLSVVLAAVATDTVIGYYQSAYNFTVAISLLSGAAGSALYPAFTSLHGRKEDLPTALKLAVKYVGFVTLPVVLLLAATSKQLIVLFYSHSFSAGATFLQLLAFASAPVILGLTVLPSLFNGIARTRLTLFMVGLGAVALFVSAPLLAISLNLGVDGLIYSLLLSNLVISLVGVYLFRLEFSAWIDFRATLSTLAAGGISFALCFLVPALSSNVAILVARLAIFSVAYLTLAPLLRAVTYDDLNILEEALGEMPVLRRPIRTLIAYEKLFAHREAQTDTVA